ncbi:MAG: cyclic pyranopterin monophosphate synthase MoaC [Planctomycetota bacterium]|jgi:cyclic pyranopterin phosphate synthase
MNKLTHTDDYGRANMVDVGHKPPQRRQAIAAGTIFLSSETIELIRKNEIKKGDVFTVAQIAGIQAAKQTSNLIPLCHPLAVDKDMRIGEIRLIEKVKEDVQ